METQIQTPDNSIRPMPPITKEQLDLLWEKRCGPEKIIAYSESLMKKWETVADEVARAKIFGRDPLPYAHRNQREMTYPFENPKALWKLVNSIYIMCFMGNQGGKTVWDATWTIMECLGIHPLQKITWRQVLELCEMKVDDVQDRPFKDVDQTIRHKPPMSWWVIGPELPAEARIKGGEDTPLVKTFYEWTPPDFIEFYRKDKIMVIGSSTVKWKGHEQETKRFAGDRIDGASFDEIPPLRVWNETKPRIMKKRGIFLLGMTPDFGSKWTAEVLMNEQDNKDYYIREMDSGDNPFMDKDYRIRVLESLGDEERMMRMTGKHVQFMGLAFPSFNRHEHVKKPFEVLNDNYNLLICDWHPVKPVCISYVTINPRNFWYVWNESYINTHIVDEVANEINSKLKYRGEDGLYTTILMRRYYIDSIADVKQIQEGKRKPISIIDMFKPLGIRFESMAWGKNNNWESSRVEVDRKFKVGELYIDPSCVHHIRQISTWGVKRYNHGDLEGVMRDVFEAENDDFCVNLMYVQHARAKFVPVQDNEYEEVWHPRASSRRIYGHGRAA